MLTDNKPIHQEPILTSPLGLPLSEAKKAVIMIHGRGGSAADILELARYLQVKDYAILAPQATDNSWYPSSFMAAIEDNEPQLTAALASTSSAVQQVTAAGITHENIYFFGFSQGACLTLEYITRNARRYGGAAAIIGGLIGKKIDPGVYQGDFNGTPVFIGTSNPDFHVPIERVYATLNILQDRHAAVTLKEYPGFGHAIHQDAIRLANELIFNQPRTGA